MKTNCLILAVIGLLMSCNPQVRESQSMLSDTDEETLRTLITTQFPQAYSEQDTAMLNQILHEKYLLVDDKGGTYRKADEMNYAAQQGPSYNSFTYEVEKIELLENGTAMISGKGTMEGTDDEGDYRTTYKSSDVFVKVDGKWKAILGHVSGVDEQRSGQQ